MSNKYDKPTLPNCKLLYKEGGFRLWSYMYEYLPETRYVATIGLRTISLIDYILVLSDRILYDYPERFSESFRDKVKEILLEKKEDEQN